MSKKPEEKRKYSRLNNLVWALKYLWKIDKQIICFAALHIPVAVILPLVASYFSKYLIDSIGAGQGFIRLAITIALFIVIQAFLSRLQFYLSNKCASHQYYAACVVQAKMADFEAYSRDFECKDDQDYIRISNYAWHDAESGNCSLEYIWSDLYNALKNLLGIFTYASLLMLLNPIIFVVVAVLAVASYFTTRWQSAYYEKNKQYWEKEIRKKDYITGLSEQFALAKDIKLFGLEKHLMKMMRDYHTYILMWNKKCNLRGAWASVLAGVMSLAQNAVAYTVLIGLLFEGSITVGDFVFYFGIVGSIAGFLQGIISDAAQLTTRADKIAYYRDMFDYPQKFNYGKGCVLSKSAPVIELRDVWYKYPGAEDYTLKGIDLTIKSGENLALVGINGSGKTTLVRLICGLYSPTKGKIIVNGREISEYNVHEYYSMISAVFQEIKAIAFTVFEFVASCDPSRPTAREDAAAAMKAAGIWEKISGLPNGMNTHLLKGIFDDGVDLSGGELQKLLLARAVYKNGNILILDEPTSSLDPIAENNLYLRYKTLTEGKTSIYISHRFASTRFCDNIILLEDGVIKESGTHEALMQKNGRYAYMFGVQSKYYKEGEADA